MCDIGIGAVITPTIWDHYELFGVSVTMVSIAVIAALLHIIVYHGIKRKQKQSAVDKNTKSNT